MAVHITTNQDLFTKLSTTSMAFKTILAKLYAHKISEMEDKKLNDEFFSAYLAAYSDTEDDLAFAEAFAHVSYEADGLLIEKGSPDV